MRVLCESSTKSSIASSSSNKELDLLGDFNLCNDFDVELFLAGLLNVNFKMLKLHSPCVLYLLCLFKTQDVDSTFRILM